MKYPPTILDAMSVTVKLGFRYLWIDRYVSLDQKRNFVDAQGHNSALIKKTLPTNRRRFSRWTAYTPMHLSLSIAAAGKDPHYGLPGVSKTFRVPQKSIIVGDIELLQIFPHPSTELYASKWATRAWTYQEAYLSRRRLIFSDHQVFYLCNRMLCVESLDNKCPGQGFDSLNMDPFQGMMPAWSSLPSMMAGWAFEIDPALYIQEYSKRELSYDSDALNACFGIFAYLGAIRPLLHISGVYYKRSSNA